MQHELEGLEADRGARPRLDSGLVHFLFFLSLSGLALYRVAALDVLGLLLDVALHLCAAIYAGFDVVVLCEVSALADFADELESRKVFVKGVLLLHGRTQASRAEGLAAGEQRRRALDLALTWPKLAQRGQERNRSRRVRSSC